MKMLILETKPTDASEYTLTISSFLNHDVVIPNHGLTTASNGVPYKYNSTVDVASGLANNTVYYIRRKNANSIGLHLTKADAITGENQIEVSGGSGIQTLLNHNYDSDLMGFWENTEALPRKSTIRRQGDRMAGPLYLADHPGELAGTITNFDEYKATTKFYVDQSSYFSSTNLYVTSTGDDRQTEVQLSKQGTSIKTAFASINKACQKAEEIILSSPIEVGPQARNLMYGDGTALSTITGASIKVPVAGRDSVKILLEKNTNFIIAETLTYLDQTYPNLTYDQAEFNENIKLILNAIILDVVSGTNANHLVIRIGLRYFSSPNLEKLVSDQKVETLAKIARIKSVVRSVLQQDINYSALQSNYSIVFDSNINVDNISITQVEDKFDIITNIINNGPLNAPSYSRWISISN